MAAASLEVDGMATPSQVVTIMRRTAVCLSAVDVITQIACICQSKNMLLQGSFWQLVQRTQAHSRSSELYTLPAFEDGWQRQR